MLQGTASLKTTGVWSRTRAGVAVGARHARLAWLLLSLVHRLRVCPREDAGWIRRQRDLGTCLVPWTCRARARRTAHNA